MSKRISHEEHIERLILWGEGYSDVKIAKERNVTSQTIQCWRKKNNIPPNYKIIEVRTGKQI